LLAQRAHAGVLEPAAKGRLFNTAWSWLGESDSYVSKSSPGFRPSRPHTTYGSRTRAAPAVFDQILVSGALLKGTTFELDEGSVGRYAREGDTAELARYGRLVPKPWTWDPVAQRGAGVSDHFPIHADLSY
jgi:hypothetical protein